MAKPRITGHQLQMLHRMRYFEQSDAEGKKHLGVACPKSWHNVKSVRVWSFRVTPHLNILGDPWDTQTGESMLKKGLIEPSFTLKHDGGYDAPDGHYHYARDREIQFYRLTELGLSYLN